MSQADKLLELLSDEEAHSTVEIMRVVYGGDHLGLARVGARVYDLKEKGYVIESRPGKINKTIWYYKLMASPEVPKKAVRTIVPVFENGRQVRVKEIISYA